MSNQYCASCEEIKDKCNFITGENLAFRIVGNDLVMSLMPSNTTIGSVSAAALCGILINAGCGLGGGGGGGAMTADQIASAICTSATAQAALGLCIRDNVAMTGGEIVAAICADGANVSALATCLASSMQAIFDTRYVNEAPAGTPGTYIYYAGSGWGPWAAAMDVAVPLSVDANGLLSINMATLIQTVFANVSCADYQAMVTRCSGGGVTPVATVDPGVAGV